MKRGTTFFLKFAVFMIGIPIFAISIFGIYYLFTHPANQQFAHILYPIVIGIYLTVIPFFIALFKAFRILNFIDNNLAFSFHSVTALQHIKYCAYSISGIYVLTLPFIFFLAELDDAPGLIIIGFVLIFASFVVAVFAAVLQRLLKEAIDIKLENDLTV